MTTPTAVVHWFHDWSMRTACCRLQLHALPPAEGLVLDPATATCSGRLEARLAEFSDAELARELSRRRVATEAPDDLPARVCSCYGAVLRGEGSADEDCPLHGREAEERAGEVELVDGLHPLCRDELVVDTEVPYLDGSVDVFTSTLYCHELAGHPPGEVDGGHGNRSGERW